jgi:hypothetical protein
MNFDYSMYQNVGQTPKIETPDVMGSFGQGMRLRQLADQGAAQNQENATKAHLQKASVFGNALESLAGMPAEKRATAYQGVRQGLINDGVIRPEDAPEQYDDGFYRQSLVRFRQTKEHLDKKLQMAQIGHMGAQDEHLRRQDQIEIAKLGKEKTGRPLAAEQTDRLAGYDASFGTVSDLRQAIQSQSDSFGPVAGRLASLNPYNTRGQATSALFKKAAQTLGKALEGGKLTDADYAKYEKMLPTMADTPAVAMQKLDQLEQMVAARRNADLDNFARAGLSVDGFQPTQLAADRGASKERAGGGIIPEAKADDKNAGMVLMVAPNGKQKWIPEAMVGEAIAAGGRRAK